MGTCMIMNASALMHACAMSARSLHIYMSDMNIEAYVRTCRLTSDINVHRTSHACMVACGI